ncbi:MAG: DJ-1/PfpI family protein [Lachnospiraceae bacterium]|nr:DJ-1/PfpI family protein [Lachnospiraceae bacterium]
MGKVCVFLAAGFEEIEALTVVDVCRRGGIDTATVSITKEREVMGSHQIPVIADCILSDLDFDQVDMIVLPGGIPGTPNLEACEPLMAALDDFHKKGKFISAICAAPSILGHRGILRGKKSCSNPNFEKELTGAEVLSDSSVTSGTIITGRGMGCSIPFALSILERFKGQEAVETVKQKMVYEQN